MSTSSNSHVDVMSQIAESLKLWRYWTLRAWLVFSRKRRTSKLGYLWEPISFLVVTLSLSLVWSIIFRRKTFTDFFPYFCAGYFVWSLMSKFAKQGTRFFRKSSGDMRNSARSPITYLCEMFCEALIPAAVNLPVVLVVLIVFGDYLGPLGIIQFLYAIVLIVITGFGFCLLFGKICFLTPDLEEVFASLLRISFLLTPVIWSVDRLREYKPLIWLNPFYGYLHIGREGLLSRDVEWLAYPVTLGITTVILIAGVWLYSRSYTTIRRRSFMQ